MRVNMEINTPAFNEKEFLSSLLSTVEKKYGIELRHILEHSFSAIDVDIAKQIPSLKKEIDNISIKKFICQWFEEAQVRELVIRPTKDQSYKLSKSGYAKALKNKHLLKHFWVEHWKYIVTTSLAFIASIVAISKLIGS
jgi:hypothetical protein